MRTKAATLYPFVPSGADFRLAMAFLAEIGFETAWERDGYAGLRRGGAYFHPAGYQCAGVAGQQMVVIEVEDLDAFWAELRPGDLPARYPGVRLKPATDFPWGREVHIVDPAGVCWHVRQADRGV